MYKNEVIKKTPHFCREKQLFWFFDKKLGFYWSVSYISHNLSVFKIFTENKIPNISWKFLHCICSRFQSVVGICWTEKFHVFHYVKSPRFRSFSGLCFPVFELIKEICRVNIRSQSECGKIQTRETSTTEPFYAAFYQGFI